MQTRRESNQKKITVLMFYQFLRTDIKGNNWSYARRVGILSLEVRRLRPCSCVELGNEKPQFTFKNMSR